MRKERSWYGIEKRTNVFGLGCWQISGIHYKNNKPHGWGDVGEDKAFEILYEAILSGIDFFDTAQGYNNGKSERLLGKAVRASKKEVLICTKVPLSEKEISNKKIGGEFRRKVERSLTNLGLPHIDILLIHNPPDNLDWGSFDYSLLNSLTEEGVLGTYGVSSKSLKGASSVVEHNIGTVLEWVFNITERRPAKMLFPKLKAKKMNFIARSPLARGLLSPKYLIKDPSFNTDDFRSALPKEWINWTVSQLRAYQAKGINPNDIIKNTLHFCAQHDSVNAVIPGMKSISQLKEYLEIISSADKGFLALSLDNIPECYPEWE